ncbi:transposase, partial [Microvirga aerilata]|uniref:transposase n=2 Tax=Microvirga aerilata TaxID=670292 RepID=UPI001FE30A6B
WFTKLNHTHSSPGNHERVRPSGTWYYYGFPDCHWIKLRTNNPLERIMREIRRRTRVVGAFPDGQSCLNLAAARLRHIAGTQWSTRKYMNMAPLRAAKNETYGAAVA